MVIFMIYTGPGKRGQIVADTLLSMMFLELRKLGNICCGHKMFLNKIRNIFVSRTQNLCPQQMLRARANGETFVSATMCRQQRVLVCQGLTASRGWHCWTRETGLDHMSISIHKVHNDDDEDGMPDYRS